MTDAGLESFSLSRARLRRSASVETDLTIIGVGIHDVHHLTGEARQAIASARTVFVSGHTPALGDLVATCNPGAVTHLQEAGEYHLGDHRPTMYERIAARILAVAVESPGVVALQPGSASLADRITRLLVCGAAERDLRVRVLPGVSAVETLLAAVGYDQAHGLQVVLAQRLLTTRLRLDPAWAAAVIQPGYYDTDHFLGAPVSRPGRYAALAERLGVDERPDHPVALVHTVADEGRDQVLWFRLRELDELGRWLSPYHTLFVPPSAPPAPDPGGEARVRSWDQVLQRVDTVDGRPVQQDPLVWRATESQVSPGFRRRSAELARWWHERRRELA
ncbi:MAG: SAM-dependent methyltransferase [Acidimicrobiales bacterium]|nr:SAM-dependent methyltransferase [Acidimicrobiales bacterium]